MSRPRIGAVSYLNTKPLVAGLGMDQNDYELIFDLPSRLADRLGQQQLDVALIPVIEAARDPSYTIVSDACIACRGPVWSVKLMSRAPLDQIKTLDLDEGSRTSQALTRVILSQRYGVRPDCRILPIDRPWSQSEADAVLIIGDRAMNAAAPDFPVEVDLGEAWNQWTDQPFVFAVWAARQNVDFDYLATLLSAARDRGYQQRRQIAQQNADSYGLSADDCYRYLDYYLHYDLGREEKQGLELFLNRAAQEQLIPNPQPLQFHDCQTA